MGHDFSGFFGDHEQVVDNVFGLPVEFLSKLRILCGDADRAGVEMTLPHHDAAERDERCGCEAVLFGSQQRCDDNIAASLELAVCLQANSASQVVHDQRLVRFSDPEFPWQTSVFDAGERRRTGSAFAA